MLGVQNSFAEVSERTLLKACGLRVSQSTVERTTEAAGERLIEHDAGDANDRGDQHGRRGVACGGEAEEGRGRRAETG